MFLGFSHHIYQFTSVLVLFILVLNIISFRVHYLALIGDFSLMWFYDSHNLSIYSELNKSLLQKNQHTIERIIISINGTTLSRYFKTLFVCSLAPMLTLFYIVFL